MNEIKINISNFGFNLLFDEKGSGKTPILFLHGFTGNAEDWLPFFNKLNGNVFPLALDLPGHGKSLNLEDEYYELENIDKVILEIIEKLNFKKIILAGYSMGGRAAYQFAVKHPQSLSGLIIESATPGLSENEFRNERWQSDLSLADEIVEKGVDWFVEYWFSLPIFNSLRNIGKEKLERTKEIRKLNNPRELSKALKGGSQGKVNHVWDKLDRINFPLLLIDGEDDKKYRFLDTLVLKEVPTAERKTVKDAGHNIHLEKPEEFIILVNSFIDKVLKEN
jgi:2-succinyl-6-hydroxy-2,4-cyclohexadiene-1-carboxylate synthase